MGGGPCGPPPARRSALVSHPLGTILSMALPLPTSLTPSKVAAFKDCALAFRFSVIDGLPEPPSAPAVKGTLVHRALELLFEAPPAERTLPMGRACLAQARVDLANDAEFIGLKLDPE